MNNEKLSTIKKWEISLHLSCSYHNRIAFNVNVAKNKAKIYYMLGTRYIIKGKQHTEFHKNVLHLIPNRFQFGNNEEYARDIEEKPNRKITVQNIFARLCRCLIKLYSQHARKRLNTKIRRTPLQSEG